LSQKFRTLKHPTRLSDDAVDQILHLVQSGHLTPGERLPSERALSEQLGIARTSIREAVRVLETIGTLRVVPGRGTYVCEKALRNEASFDDRWIPAHYLDLLDLLEMREALEVKAAALAAARSSDEQVEQLYAKLEQETEAVRNQEIEEAVLFNAEFHNLIARASGNERIGHVLESLEGVALDTQKLVARLQGRLEHGLVEHRDIADAIRAHDVEGASRAMFAHVSQIQAELRSTLSQHRPQAVSDGRAASTEP